MRVIFVVLLMANLWVWLVANGQLDPGPALRPNSREPARLQQQLEPEKLLPLTAAAYAQKSAMGKTVTSAAVNEMTGNVTPEKPESAEALAATGPITSSEPPEGATCLQISGVDDALASKLLSSWQNLRLGGRLQQKKVADNSQWLVFIPPRSDRATAEKKVAELKAYGIFDTYIINELGPLRWAISLGIFRSKETAEQHLAKVQEKGVKTAKVGPRSPDAGTTTFTLQKLKPEEFVRIQNSLTEYKTLNKQNC